MMRTDRDWTAVVAECGLDRAQPVIAALCPEPFARVNLAEALAKTAVVLGRGTAFADLRPKLEAALGPDAETVLRALARLPFDPAACKATAFWRGMFRDLHGRAQPALQGDAARNWAAFTAAFRGRTNALDAVEDWLAPIVLGSQAHRNLADLVKTQRGRPLTRHDRSLYVRFGWNDDGSVPGMTGLLDASALLRTQAAWRAVAFQFDAASQDIIAAAARDLVEAQRTGAMAMLDDDVKRYGVPRERLASALYPQPEVPPLSGIEQEAG